MDVTHVFIIRKVTYFNESYNSCNLNIAYTDPHTVLRAMIGDMETVSNELFEGYKKENLKETVQRFYARIEDTVTGHYCEWHIETLHVI